LPEIHSCCIQVFKFQLSWGFFLSNKRNRCILGPRHRKSSEQFKQFLFRALQKLCPRNVIFRFALQLKFPPRLVITQTSSADHVTNLPAKTALRTQQTTHFCSPVSLQSTLPVHSVVLVLTGGCMLSPLKPSKPSDAKYAYMYTYIEVFSVSKIVTRPFMPSNKWNIYQYMANTNGEGMTGMICMKEDFQIPAHALHIYTYIYIYI